jgi:hypothetical protein
MNNEINLNEIPERFHVIFTTDWNDGNHSEMTSMQRAAINDIFLEYNKWKIQQILKQNSSTNEDEIQLGFVKD